jgi:hypothetical protein
MAHPASEAFEQGLAASIKYARSAEKLIAATAALMAPAEALAELHKFDDDLAPEVAVALAHIGEAMEALRRASTFQDARFDATMAAALASLDGPLQEGDPS